MSPLVTVLSLVERRRRTLSARRGLHRDRLLCHKVYGAHARHCSRILTTARSWRRSSPSNNVYAMLFKARIAK